MNANVYTVLREAFFKHFSGLNDPRYLEEERNYKVAAAQKARAILDEKTFRQLIDQGDLDELFRRLRSICAATNLINWRDYEVFRTERIPDADFQERLAEGLYSLIFDEAKPIRERIDALVSIVEEQATPSNTWNLITYLLFIYHPTTYYHVKPSTWGRICKELRIDNPRQVKMTGTSYEKILAVCTDVAESLRDTDLAPRDMVDLHSIFYIVTDYPDTSKPPRYWVVKIYDRELWKLCKEQHVVAVQYEYRTETKQAVTKALNRLEQISTGDYVVAALQGQNGQLLAYSVASSELYRETDDSKLYGGQFAQRIDVQRWKVALDEPILIDEFEEKYALDHIPYSAAFEISPEGFEVAKARLHEKAMENPAFRVYNIFEQRYAYNVVLEGPPGTGKTFTALQVVEYALGAEWRELQFHSLSDFSRGAWEIVQFHPNYSFEDFVRGLVAVPTENGVTFTAKDKLFARMCQAAENNPQASFYLIIDEINRGDLSKILGELIYGLEYRDRPISLLYAVQREDGTSSSRLAVPSNLFIIGTMNIADRSIALVDYAIRRRFAFIRLLPDRRVIENHAGFENELVRQQALSAFDSVQALFDDGNEDYRLGHSYFLACNQDELRFRLEHQVRPILEEYTKEGILEPEQLQALEVPIA